MSICSYLQEEWKTSSGRLKIDIGHNPVCTLFNSECTTGAGNTLRIGAALESSIDWSLCTIDQEEEKRQTN